MQKEFVYTRDCKSYKVCVTYKHIKNIIYRYRDGIFYISAPRFTMKSQIFDNLSIFYPRLVKEKKTDVSPIIGSSIYMFGNLATIVHNADGSTTIEGYFTYHSEEELNALYKKTLLEKITPIVREFEMRMSVERPYRVRISNMKTRYGTNSRRTHALTFETRMVHFSMPVIESLVVHELAHDKYFDHSKNFYDYVLQFCPNYKALHKQLRKRIYQ